MFHVDESIVKVFTGAKLVNTTTNDHICCICVQGNALLVGRESGTVHHYNLQGSTPTLQTKYLLQCRPSMLSLNSTCTKLAVTDINAVFSLYSLNDAKKDNALEKIEVEKKDVWDMLWSDDNPDHLAIMEKTKLHIVSGTSVDTCANNSGCMLTILNNFVVRFGKF